MRPQPYSGLLRAADGLAAREFWRLAAAALCAEVRRSGQSPLCIMHIDEVHMRPVRA
jgi:hypothetical protein